MAFIQKVRDNFEGFTKKETTAAKLAHKYQGTICHSSEIDFKSIVSNYIIQNFPINACDFTNTHTTFGSNLAETRGKTV